MFFLRPPRPPLSPLHSVRGRLWRCASREGLYQFPILISSLAFRRRPVFTVLARLSHRQPMPITLACPCGKPLRVGDQHAGKLVKCPICGATQRASHPATDLPVAAKPPARAPRHRTTSKYSRRRYQRHRLRRSRARRPRLRRLASRPRSPPSPRRPPSQPSPASRRSRRSGRRKPGLRKTMTGTTSIGCAKTRPG